MFLGVILSAGYSYRLIYLGLLKRSNYTRVRNSAEDFTPIRLAGLLLALLSVRGGCRLS